MSYDEKARERQKRYRDRVKLEDSTRGNSAVLPRTYKRDIPVQVWIESRYLATLSEWLDETGGERTKFLAEVVNEGIVTIVDHLVRTGAIEMIDDPIHARDKLKWKYRLKLRDPGYGVIGSRNQQHNAVLTEQRREVAGSVVRGEKDIDVRDEVVNESRRINVVEDEYIKMTGMTREEAERAFWEADRKLKEEKITRGIKKQLEVAKQNIRCVPEPDDNARRAEEENRKIANMPDIPDPSRIVDIDD